MRITAFTNSYELTKSIFRVVLNTAMYATHGVILYTFHLMLVLCRNTGILDNEIRESYFNTQWKEFYDDLLGINF